MCGYQSCPLLGGTVQDACGFCQEGLCEGQPKFPQSLTIVQPRGTLAEAREHFEREFILDILERMEWSRTAASKELGLSRKALWEKCKRYGISSPDESED